MARKPNKRRQQAQRPRRPAGTGGAGTATTVAPSSTSARATSESRRVGGDQALVRSVEMSLSPGTPSTGRRGGRVVLENADPAIPLDRVPYFVTDLARLGVVAAAMVVLLVIGAVFVIPHFVPQ